MVLNNDHSNELFCNEAQSINPIHRLAAKYKYTTSIVRPRLWKKEGGKKEENETCRGLFVCLFVCLDYIDATSCVTRNAF